MSVLLRCKCDAWTRERLCERIGPVKDWRVSMHEFEGVVEEALAELPDEFKELLENVAVVVEQEPSAEDLDAVELDDDEDLLGIFRGPALTERSFNDIPSLPCQVAVFRGPILRACSSRDEAVEEIRDTVVHELGHYFGLEDDEMEY